MELTSRPGLYPSPGHKTFAGDLAARPLAGQWQLSAVESAFTAKYWSASTRTVTVGVPARRKDNEGKDGKNLIYDNYPGYSDTDGKDDGDPMDTTDGDGKNDGDPMDTTDDIRATTLWKDPPSPNHMSIPPAMARVTPFAVTFLKVCHMKGSDETMI